VKAGEYKESNDLNIMEARQTVQAISDADCDIKIVGKFECKTAIGIVWSPLVLSHQATIQPQKTANGIYSLVSRPAAQIRGKDWVINNRFLLKWSTKSVEGLRHPLSRIGAAAIGVGGTAVILNNATKEQQGERELHRVFRAMKEKINKEEELAPVIDPDHYRYR